MSVALNHKGEPGGDRSLQRERFPVLLTASLVSSLIMLNSNIVAVSLPAIGRSLSASFTDIQWVISAYVLTYAALLLATGSYADLHGRRKAMLIGLVVFASASAACGIAANSLALNLARGAQGVGGAFLLTASLAIISAEFTGEARANAFAFWGASIGIALAVGPIIGGAITNIFGWRWIFLVNVPVCALLVAATLRVVAESRDPAARQLDIAGIVTFSLGLGLLIWGLIDGNDDGWTSVGILLRLIAAGLLFGAFVIVELRQARPMVDFALFQSRTFVGAVLAMIGYGASAQVMVFFLPLFLQNAYGYAPLVAGIAMLPFAAPMVLARRLTFKSCEPLFRPCAPDRRYWPTTLVGNLLFWAVARAQLPLQRLRDGHAGSRLRSGSAQRPDRKGPGRSGSARPSRNGVRARQHDAVYWHSDQRRRHGRGVVGCRASGVRLRGHDGGPRPARRDRRRQACHCWRSLRHAVLRTGRNADRAACRWPRSVCRWVCRRQSACRRSRTGGGRPHLFAGRRPGHGAVARGEDPALQARRLPGPAMTSAAGKAERDRSKIEGRLASTDPALGRVIDAVIARIGPQRIAPSRTTPFEALVRAIVYQSVSGKAAASIFTRLKESADGPLTPAKILALPSSAFRKAGLSATKAQSIGNLAAWFTTHRKLASALPTLADEQVVETLTAIAGIGPWTVNVFLIFSLGRLDVMPAVDLGIRRGVQLTDGLSAVATPKQVLERSQAWRPFRSIASIYLWQATKLKLGPNDLNQGEEQ